MGPAAAAEVPNKPIIRTMHNANDTRYFISETPSNGEEKENRPAPIQGDERSLTSHYRKFPPSLQKFRRNPDHKEEPARHAKPDQLEATRVTLPLRDISSVAQRGEQPADFVVHVCRIGKRLSDLGPQNQPVTSARYERSSSPRPTAAAPVRQAPSDGWGSILRRMLASPNGCSRYPLFRRYDSEVQGHTVLRPGEADAGVVMPLDGCPAGIAMTADGNPRLGELDPYLGALFATAEAARNVACVGARPSAITDCLNYGNPEQPEVFWQFSEGLRGIGDACRGLGLIGHPGAPLPVVSGNVSFYNQSSKGRAVPPSPIIACVGVIADARHATVQHLTAPDQELLFVGRRGAELGGSLYYDVLYGESGGELPPAELDRWRRELEAVAEFVGAGRADACHDVSDGGLALCLSEAALGTYLAPGIGLEADLTPLSGKLTVEALLFNETPGYLLAVPAGESAAALTWFRERNVEAASIGRAVPADRFRLVCSGVTLADEPLSELRQVWENGLTPVFGA